MCNENQKQENTLTCIAFLISEEIDDIILTNIILLVLLTNK